MAPSTISEAAFERLTEDLIAIVKPAADARAALDTAKDGVTTNSEMSIRGIAARMSKLNGTLSPKQLNDLPEKIAKDCYPNSEAKAKAEFKVLIEKGRDLPHILVGLDKVMAKIKAADPKAKAFNIRQATISAARKLRDDPDLTVAEAIRKLDLDKAPPTTEELARVQLERLRKAAPFQDDVGDEKMLKHAAAKAFGMLEAVLAGEEPGEDPRVAELEEKVAALEELMSVGMQGEFIAPGEAWPEVDSESEKDIDVFADPDPEPSPVEAAEGTLQTDEESVVLDTSEIEEAPPAPADAPAEPSSAIKKAATGKNFAGFDNLDDLLADLQTKPKG